MHLVEDDHLAGQREMPQGKVPAAQSADEDLVNRADDEGAEHALLTTGQPRVRDGRAALPVVLVITDPLQRSVVQTAERVVQTGLAMGQVRRPRTPVLRRRGGPAT